MELGKLKQFRSWMISAGIAVLVSVWLASGQIGSGAPEDDLVVRINNQTESGSFFNAALILKRQEITGRTLAGVLFKYPFITLKVMFGIHWQAFRLWLKGVPVQTHPDKNQSIQVTS